MEVTDAVLVKHSAIGSEHPLHKIVCIGALVARRQSELIGDGIDEQKTGSRSKQPAIQQELCLFFCRLASEPKAPRACLGGR